MIKQIGPPLRGRPILLITRTITDRIGLHSVLLPLQIAQLAPVFQKVNNTIHWINLYPLDNAIGVPNS